MTDSSFENRLIQLENQMVIKSGGKLQLIPTENSFRLYAGEKPIGRTMEIYAIFATNDGWEKAERMFLSECDSLIKGKK